MSLETVKKNFTDLVKVLSDSGVTLTESQKQVFDNFMNDFENTINETVKKTTLVVESKLEKQYKEIVESIIKNSKAHADLAGKVQSKVASATERQSLVESVDMYLDKYLEEVLPQKAIVDYARMEKLESIHESLKNMLGLKDSEIDERVCEAKEKAEKEVSDLSGQCDNLKKDVEEKTQTCESLKSQIEDLNKKLFIAESVKNLTSEEAKLMESKLEKLSLNEAKENYQKLYESVQAELKNDAENTDNQGEKNLEEAITDIIERKSADSKENCKKDSEDTTESPDNTEDQEDGTTEVSDKETEEEPQVISESYMSTWISNLARFAPQY